MEVAKDGMALYEADDRELATPKPKTPEQSLAMAREYFEDCLPSAQSFHRGFRHAVDDGDFKKAAFDLHQATERLYGCLLLTLTFRSEEHTSELQSLMRKSYAVFCLKKKTRVYASAHAVARLIYCLS